MLVVSGMPTTTKNAGMAATGRSQGTFAISGIMKIPTRIRIGAATG